MNNRTLINIFARDDFTKHPILNQINKVLSENYGVSNIRINLRNLWKVFSTPLTNEEIFTDPISFCLRNLALYFYRRTDPRTIFFSLEMFEFQVTNTTWKKRLRNRIYLYCHHFTLRKANKVFFPNSLRREHYCNEVLDLNSRSGILPNYPDNASLVILRSNVLEEDVEQILLESNCAAQDDLINKTIFIYAGSLREDNISLKKLIINLSNIKNTLILICGKVLGDQESIFSQKNVLYLGEIERSNVLKLIAFSDFGIAHYGHNTLNVEYAAPVKVFEYLAGGVRVLCNENKGVRSLNDENIIYYNSKGDLPESYLYNFIQKSDIPSFDSILKAELCL